VTEREEKLLNKLERLSDEHRMLQQTLTEAIQPRMRDLLAQERRADQIVQAVNKGSAKSPGYMPKVEEGYWPTLRKLVAEAVYSIYNENHRPTRDRREVVPIVLNRIEEMRKTGQWPRGWKTPGKDSIVRRLNETADVRHYPDGETATVCVQAGSYIPNPRRFEEPTASEIQVLATGWKKG